MPFHPPHPFNIADYFLDDRIREGLGERIALRTRGRTVTYASLRARANRFANALEAMRVRPGERVLIGLPDIPDFPAALFGTLKRGAVGVMVNCYLGEQRIRELYEYTRATAAVVHAEHADVFARATRRARHAPRLLVLGTDEGEARIDNSSLHYVNYASHSDDPAIWLFSGRDHGSSQGRGPEPRLLRQLHRVLREAGHRLHSRRHHALRPQALLRLRHRFQPLLPPRGGRVHGALPRALHRRRALRADRAAPSPRSSSTSPPW